LKSRKNLDIKIVISVILVGLTLTSSLIVEKDFALAAVSTSKTLTSIGSISSFPVWSKSLPNSVIGDDYLWWQNWNGDPTDSWGLPSTLSTLQQLHCTGARLFFTFADCPGAGIEGQGAASTLTYTKLDQVLTYLNSVGVKAIICDWSSFGLTDGWYGGAKWRADWVALATHYAGDNRIKAFELINEPYDFFMVPSAKTMSSFNSACASLIDSIRAVDPSRTIMYPLEVGILTESSTEFYNDLVSKGIPAKGNILYDIVHPYYFQDLIMDGGIDEPSGKADWYWNNYVLPQISYFGVQNCWSGEMFCWPRGPNHGWNGNININYNDQQIFVRRMINYFVGAGMGFQMLQYLTSRDQQAQVDALTNSNYMNLIQ
jgi:hypothetical protein